MEVILVMLVSAGFTVCATITFLIGNYYPIIIYTLILSAVLLWQNFHDES